MDLSYNYSNKQLNTWLKSCLFFNRDFFQFCILKCKMVTAFLSGGFFLLLFKKK